MNKSLLSFSSYTGYFLVGIVALIFAPTLPIMIKDFDITLGIAGIIFPAYSIGSFTGVLLGGILSDITGKKALIIVGSILQAVGLAFIPIVSSWAVVLGIFSIMGLGRGFLNTCFNAFVADINPHRRGAALNALHGVYGIGSLIGPLIIGLLLTFQYSWKLIYFGVAGIWMVYTIVNIFLQYPTTGHIKKFEIKVDALKTIISSRVFILLFLISFIYNGAATGLVGWINTYMDQMKYPALFGASMVSVFYLGLTLGRFICSYLSDRWGYSKTILACAIGSFIFYPLTIFTSSPVTIALGAFFSGLFFSGLHPTGLAYANTIFSSISGTVTGLLSAAMSLGAMSIPWFIGLVAENSNFKAGLSIGYILVTILVCVAVFLILTERREKRLVKIKNRKEGVSSL